mmetsp:Transcript_202/g.413  ORF Transcript_202/g.413 Transcript_202/m.413 type:complete len:100 (-) Transcript_202:145-444(-)
MRPSPPLQGSSSQWSWSLDALMKRGTQLGQTATYCRGIQIQDKFYCGGRRRIATSPSKRRSGSKAGGEHTRLSWIGEWFGLWNWRGIVPRVEIRIGIYV